MGNSSQEQLGMSSSQNAFPNNNNESHHMRMNTSFNAYHYDFQPSYHHFNESQVHGSQHHHTMHHSDILGPTGAATLLTPDPNAPASNSNNFGGNTFAHKVN
jgi:hypothetical protein